MDTFKAALGQQVTASANEQVTTALSGIVPSASLPVAQNTSISYKEMMTIIMDDPDGLKKSNPALYAKYLEEFRTNPAYGPLTLHPDHEDPFQSDYERRSDLLKLSASNVPVLPFGERK